MAVFRIERTRDYTVMSNHHLRNGKLSLKAKGLLSIMLSLPDDWAVPRHDDQVCRQRRGTGMKRKAVRLHFTEEELTDKTLRRAAKKAERAADRADKAKEMFCNIINVRGSREPPPTYMNSIFRPK